MLKRFKIVTLLESVYNFNVKVGLMVKSIYYLNKL